MKRAKKKRKLNEFKNFKKLNNEFSDRHLAITSKLDLNSE